MNIMDGIPPQPPQPPPPTIEPDEEDDIEEVTRRLYRQVSHPREVFFMVEPTADTGTIAVNLMVRKVTHVRHHNAASNRRN